MVRELIQIPIRVTDTVVGGIVGLIRSQVGDGSPSPTSAPAERPEPMPEPAHRDSSASDWDEDAPVAPGGSSPDDLVITDRVKSELFAVVDVPKGEINLNVENGVLYIRGHLDDAEQIDDLVTLAKGVEGVVRVENLISG
jgi:hyperosmotically inducible periplasmic protein